MSRTPTPPIGFDAGWGEIASRLEAVPPPQPEGWAGLEPPVVERLSEVCQRVDTDDESCIEAGRDWWPLAVGWAIRHQVPWRAGAVARPADASEVAAVLAVCQAHRVPVTAAGGRSGVCGASVPLYGGVALDMCAMSGITDVDEESLLVSVLPGTFGDDLEAELRAEHGLTLGHWPQSVAISTVGGWLACRSAGQYSTRYGKIEDIVRDMEVVLADGSALHTGARAPRAAAGPDLTALFVGSEGTLGVTTAATFAAHPLPPAELRRAWGFGSFRAGLECCRRILQRGATPAVLRLYDQAESARHFGTEDLCALVLLDEGDEALVDATVAVGDQECRRDGSPLPEALVAKWLETRNDTSALAPLYEAGVVVDTIEVAARWAALPSLYESAVAAVRSVEGTLVASAHQSHSYTDGACLYFTFAGRGEDPADSAWAEHYYTRAWDAVMGATMAAGGAISHHHGIGLNRARYMQQARGEALALLGSLKSALDPTGILNPGKLGLDSPFGRVTWP